MTPKRFEFSWASDYRSLARLFGTGPANAWVQVSAADLSARFGLWSLTTPLSNVAGVSITGPYRWWKTAGPARLGITDGGLTFASNGDRGVLIEFIEPVRGRGPYLALRHPELTVTVKDVDGLAQALRSGGGT